MITDFYSLRSPKLPGRTCVTVALIGATLICCLSFIGCSRDADQQSEGNIDTIQGTQNARTYPLWQDSAYTGWVAEPYGSVMLHYPESHQHLAEMPDAAAGYMRAINTIAARLNKTLPSDTIHVYYYTGPWQGETITDTIIPFGDSTGVHYWPNFARGVSLMQHLLLRWYPEGTTQPVIHHGLIALFDFDGKDYHQITLEMLKDDTMFIPLSRLSTDPGLDSEQERRQSAEAASLVGFLLGQYGPGTIESLYLARDPFDSAVQRLTGLTVDSLQSEWLAYARAVTLQTTP